MSEDTGNFLSIALDGFRQLVAGVGSLVTQWVLMGEVGPAALRKLLASIIAHYAGSWIIKAIDLTAEGFSYIAKASAAAASGNLVAAALYKTAATNAFISAAKYGAAGAAAAVVGRAVAGNSGREGSQGAASGALGQRESEPRNATFKYGDNSLATPASTELSGGSRGGGIGNMIMRLVERVEAAQKQNAAVNARLDSTLSRLSSLPAGQVVAMGAADAQRELGAVVLKESAENYELPKTLLEHMGFNR
jgi:hypothetical protein